MSAVVLSARILFRCCRIQAPITLARSLREGWTILDTENIVDECEETEFLDTP